VTSAKKFRAACYTIEGLNSFAVVIYFNYLYFYFRDTFHFNDRQNLELAAFLGLTYVFASLWAGKIARRTGYFAALKIGFAVMAAGLLVGAQLHSVTGAVAAACVVNFGMCFIWPVLEALVSEGADAARSVGIYNITWATTNATSFFLGGTLIEKLGYQSIFFVPLGFMVLQFVMIFWLEKIYPPRSGTGDLPVSFPSNDGGKPPAETHRRDACAAMQVKNFQRLAWLANPLAYIAINTLIAVLPGLAHKFNLSPMFAGFACSLWCFARVGAFVVLWKWSGWHYRFGWLAGAFALMVVAFAVILVSPSLAVIFAAQIFFGATAGLMYYSSLFYAMDAQDSTSEHGGIHEAAIGIGNFLGPATGAAALWLAPQNSAVGAWAVTGLLTLGFGGLLWVRKKS
jgi:MFS family permease